jgi:hypothetical protein
MNAPVEEGEAHAKVSKRENRLYIGNLAYDCNYKDLEKFMKGGAFGWDFLAWDLVSWNWGLDLDLDLDSNLVGFGFGFGFGT